ncbi:GNAT family N-acetyltransferase [Arthrobacter sp. 35W]|uniref:GNAT family N-acetyltransferase n=1 Tax=Arthrobacter sp. 35W TaxID=1132441 RepID=UPI0004039A2A|nr:GNAT family N-acetyltransferase [Arthrobacter sp. 35W]
MSSISIVQLGIPQSLQAPGAGPFVAAAELANLVERDTQGSGDFATSPAAALARAQRQDYDEKLLLAAYDGGELVGRASLNLPLADNLHLADLHIQVHPDHRRRGAGSALLARATELARERGRTVLCGWSDHLEQPGTEAAGRTLVATTGAGSVSLEAAAAGFAVAHGFVLEQVDKISVLHLAAPGPGQAEDPAVEPPLDSRGGFELLLWNGRCPEAVLEAYADLRRRMSTEVPLGGLDLHEERWDGARVRAEEDEVAAKGSSLLVAVAREAATGALAGHTVLEHSPDVPAVAFQNDTLVLPSYRGHGLGRRMKDANLAAAGREWPTVERIYTFNAEENANMLAINIAMGFVRAGATATWQKILAAPQGPPMGEP